MRIDWPSAITIIIVCGGVRGERRSKDILYKRGEGVNVEKLVALVSDLLRCLVVVVRIESGGRTMGV